MDNWQAHWKGIAAALLAGLALRAAFVHWQPYVFGDSLVYGDLAANLLHKHAYGFSSSGGGVSKTLIRLPGYPLFLAACFVVFGTAKYTAVLWVQVLIDLLTCCFVAATAKRMGGRRAGLAALWLSALCPFTANYTAAPLTETLVLFTIAAAFYALCRWWSSATNAEGNGIRWAWLLGAALALSILLRPDQGLLAVAAVGAISWAALRGSIAVRKRGLAAMVLLCVVIAAPLSVWAARNWRAFHVFQPLAPRYANDPGEAVDFGYQRWYRTWATEFSSTDEVYWPYGDTSIAVADLPARACDNAGQCARTAALLDEYDDTTTATPALDAAFAQLAEERVRAHPLRYYVEMPLLRLTDMLLRPRTELLDLPVRWWQWRAHPLQTMEEGAYGTLNLAYLLVAVAGLAQWKRARWQGFAPVAGAMVLFVLLRCALLLTVDNSEQRYTLEFFPIIIVCAAMLWSKPYQASG